MSAQILQDCGLTSEIVRKFSKQWASQKNTSTEAVNFKKVRQKLLMQRLRAERKGLDVTSFPKRIRRRKQIQFIVPQIVSGTLVTAICKICFANFFYPWKGMRQHLCPIHTNKYDIRYGRKKQFGIPRHQQKMRFH